MRKFGYSLAVVSLVGLVLSMGLAGCSDDEPGGGSSTTVGVSTTSGPTTTAEGPAVITVQEALSAQGPVRVVGAVIATYPDEGTTGGGADPAEPTIVLTTAMAESYPPQPGGPTIVLTGLDLEDLVGLSTTVGEADVAPATWTNYWLVIEGTVSDGTLEVTATPTVIRAITPELLIRFSVVTDPVVSGGSEWFAFDVRNESEGPLDLIFPSGQEAEVILSQDGVEKYRWSEGLLFTEAIKTVTLQLGDVYPLAIYDTVDVPPGRYDLTASITAAATANGEEVQLPALEGVLDVR
jgi:hypothetical protein